MPKINYYELKKSILKSIKQIDPNRLTFIVDAEKMNIEKLDANLYVFNAIENFNVVSKSIREMDIVLISEYFKEDKLNWIDPSSMEYMIIPFVYYDEEAEGHSIMEHCKLNGLGETPDSVPFIKHVYATLPTYTAMVIGYKNNSMRANGKSSYEIIIRANSVATKKHIVKEEKK